MSNTATRLITLIFLLQRRPLRHRRLLTHPPRPLPTRQHLPRRPRAPPRLRLEASAAGAAGLPPGLVASGNAPAAGAGGKQTDCCSGGKVTWAGVGTAVRCEIVLGVP